MTDRYSKLPVEIVGLIFSYTGIKDKPAPILHYPVWQFSPAASHRSDPADFDSTIYEDYTTAAPIALPDAARQPKLIFDPPELEGLVAIFQRLRDENKLQHALYDVYPPFQAEYVKQLGPERLMVMIDLEFNVLKDKSRWDEIFDTGAFPDPRQTKYLYIRVASTTIINDNSDTETLTSMLDFLTQFPNLVLFNIDAIQFRYKHTQEKKDKLPRVPIKLAKMVVEAKNAGHFEHLENYYILRSHFTTSRKVDSEEGEKIGIYWVQRQDKSTRVLWKERQIVEMKKAKESQEGV